MTRLDNVSLTEKDLIHNKEQVTSEWLYVYDRPDDSEQK